MYLLVKIYQIPGSSFETPIHLISLRLNCRDRYQKRFHVHTQSCPYPTWSVSEVSTTISGKSVCETESPKDVTNSQGIKEDILGWGRKNCFIKGLEKGGNQRE
ncbi:hypothetical protein VTN49DRAFT_5063 [Thermomyces lanuginosus]|uniref:uncharacterized protein n=1 Tax=Thermomyces lanuginosus TaxID=5541 RepID=UPI003744478D